MSGNTQIDNVNTSEGTSVPGLVLEDADALHKFGTLIVVTVPFLAFLIAVVLLWEKAVSAQDLFLVFFMHVIAGLGITVGFHRMLTHRSFEAKPWVKWALTSAGSLAIEGPPIKWVADHRRHHDFADEEGDPHSPYVGHEAGGFWNSLKGAWHAHIGWFFDGKVTPPQRYARDLLNDDVVLWVNRRFAWFIVAALVLPGLLGFMLSGGSWWAALTGVFWGGAVRIFITHHVTWSVNSICHMFGRRPFQSDDKSTNNWLLAIPTLGEAWHHNHHTFPTSAFHGLRRWQKALDPSGWVVWLLENTGQIWNVKRVSDSEMKKKLRNS